MRVASRGVGGRAAAVALLSQVKPTFMAPALASSVYGALLAGVVAPVPTALHLLATFLALYAAHVRDGYVDTYVRGEDESFPLTSVGCRLAIVVAVAGFSACLAGLWRLVDPTAGLLVLPLFVLGYLHAPWLDRHPVGTSADYAVAVALVVAGGYFCQAGSLAPLAVGSAAVFVPVVAAGAILVDVEDLSVDRRLGKRTVPAIVGPRAARFVAVGLVTLAALQVVAMVAFDVLPTRGLLAAAVLGIGAVATAVVGPRRGLWVLMGALAVAAGLVLLATTALPPT